MAPKPPSNLYPITIIGAGITGLSTAFHLHKLGIGPVRLYHKPSHQSLSQATPAYVSGGCWDNFTRISHAKGLDFASHFWRFGNKAFEELRSFCLNHNLSWAQGSRLRLICSKEELKEASQAISELGREGFTEPQFWAREKLKGFSSRVLEVQDDGARGGRLDAQQLLSFLQSYIVSQGTKCEASKILGLRETPRGIEVKGKGGLAEHTEMLVLACHDEIGNLLPDLREAVVPVADQWSPFSVESSAIPQALSGQLALMSAHHTYEWGLLLEDGSLLGGGCRYLRKHAGIGLFEAEFDSKIESKNLQQFNSWFAKGGVRPRRGGEGGLAIYPCDEMPLIGPMFGTDRVALATGFMHLGLSYGFFAGKCLAELIHSGQCDSLPRQFWPERLRSL